MRDFHHEEIQGTMSLDWEGLYGMTMSLSHTPRVGEPKYLEFEQGLRTYFDRYAIDGVVTWQTRYWINTGRLGLR